MNLLILTQKIDKEDPVLGFFHNWIEKLSSNFEKVTVICLEKGEYSLPSNVSINSLGKGSVETHASYFITRLRYIFKFFNLCFFQSLNYDAVFVHMNQEYVLLGGIFWKILKKKIYFWRNHPQGNILTEIPVLLSDKVFCTSKFAYVAKYKKTILMPAGIDTDKFRVTSHESRAVNSILFLGRMDKIKRPDLLIEALNILDKKGTDFVCDFYGDPTLGNKNYFESLKEKVKELKLLNKINFCKGVPNYETPKIYNEHQIFVNLTPSGSMDKTILESVSCGCVPIVVNTFFKDIFDSNMIVKENVYDISNKIYFWLNANKDTIKISLKKLQKYILENHSLNVLMDKLEKELKN